MIKTVFFGTPQIAVKSLEYLANCKDIEVVAVVTQEDKPSGRGHKLCAPPIKQTAEKLGIQVFQPKSIRKEPEIINALKELNPDFFVTFAFGQILSQEVLDIPKYSTINLHASLLPKYRGANPIQRCIFNGDKETGITTMITVLELDAGDICLCEKINITPEMTDTELSEIISEKSPPLIEKTLIGLENKTIKPQKQNKNEVSFADKFSKTDGLINFEKEANDTVNQVRAMYSWPTAYTYYKGKILKVLNIRAGEPNAKTTFGEVVSISKNGIEVSAKGGTLILKEVKPEGKGIMPARAWANGSGIKTGDKLGV